MYKPRPHQQEVLRYTGGKLGVSAVPGSGKTQTLSMLAADLITEGRIDDDQEILIVTLVNSAVDNFTLRIEGELKRKKSITGFGYRVRTLHGLAHDIVRERPDLTGLSNDFIIADERDAHEILATAAQSWIRRRPDLLEMLIVPDLDGFQLAKVQREWPDLVVSLAGNFIRMAKDLQISSNDLQQKLHALNAYYPLLEMGADIYADYQRALNYRSALDFDDLIGYALAALKADPEYLARLQRRWPYILEDEAQDSSRLQKEILELLSGPDGNWVRVGDPNQAIYETFTTASPEYLKRFLVTPGVKALNLPQSGRSTHSIIDLANEMIRWTMNEHPNEELRDALTLPLIEPTARDDPQANPPDQPGSVYLSEKSYTPADEIQTVARSAKQWLAANKDSTLAILDTRNRRGNEIAEELKKLNVQTVELLTTSSSTRKTVELVSAILHCLSDPTSTMKLARTFHSLYSYANTKPENGRDLQKAGDLLRNCTRLEDYLWPAPGNDWLEILQAEGLDQATQDWLAEFREIIRSWQGATLLPIDQLVLTISQGVFGDAADLALAHKLALSLEQAAGSHPEWRLPEFTEELDAIVRRERKFSGFGEEEQGFDPEQHHGKAVITTLHKAKGLEWDRVYLLSANNYDFPSGDETDQFIAEKWFINGNLNLEAEALSQLQALAQDDRSALSLEIGTATRQARLEYARERLRLLFVGITRAKKELWISWNSGRFTNLHAAVAYNHLVEYWKERANELEP